MQKKEYTKTFCSQGFSPIFTLQKKQKIHYHVIVYGRFFITSPDMMPQVAAPFMIMSDFPL